MCVVVGGVVDVDVGVVATSSHFQISLICVAFSNQFPTLNDMVLNHDCRHT